jgi:hypothetical protein
MRLVRAFKKYFWLNSIFTKEDRQFRLGWRQILCGIALSVLICWLLDRVGRFDLSRPVLAIVGTLFITMRLRWRLRDRLWFWASIIVFVALSGFLTSAMTWSTEGPSRGIIGGFMGISVYCLFVVLHGFEMWSNRASLSNPKRSQSSQYLRRQP